ncbi:hypothetical protein RCC89_06405 [Cytophagaceae bacterium ABcell3]|nr:hypothetical protein RCC89_06405 [Cytophagaceae bacterium ABcell3]
MPEVTCGCQTKLPDIAPPTLSISLRMGEDILMKLGGQEKSAKKASRIFYEMDEKSLREMANIYKEKKSYISTTREKIKEIEDVLKQDKIQAIAGASKEEDKISLK